MFSGLRIEEGRRRRRRRRRGVLPVSRSPVRSRDSEIGKFHRLVCIVHTCVSHSAVFRTNPANHQRQTLIRMIHRGGGIGAAAMRASCLMEHFPLVDAGESELVRGSRSGQGPHEVKPSYLRVLGSPACSASSHVQPASFVRPFTRSFVFSFAAS